MDFHQHHKLCNLVNYNTIKTSYSCIPNFKAEIIKHNKNTLENPRQKHPETQLCKCITKNQFPFNEQYLTGSFVYHANIIAKHFEL